MHNDHQIYIYPDYTVEAMVQRWEFHEVTSVLKAKEVKYSLRFPAKLHVHYIDYIDLVTKFVVLFCFSTTE